MDWKTIKIPEGSKLYRIHKFTYMHGGVNYLLEINEAGGTWIGHGEHATDKNSVIPSVSGNCLEDCVNQLISSINVRG
mgnify:CR=1 FL=1